MPLRKACLVVALGAACAGAGTAQAAIVHRCRAADGLVVFRDAPCAPDETTIDRREFVDPAPAASAPGAAVQGRASRRGVAPRASPDARSAHAAAGRGATGRAGARAFAPPRLPRHDRIVAHECRFGEQRWVQAAACPRSLTMGGRGGKPEKRAVDETRLTAAQVCGALRHVSSADAPGEGSARRGYGMNRLRQQHGC